MAAPQVGRPRPWLLVALGVVVALYAAVWMMPGKSAVPAAPQSNRRVPATAAAQTPVPDVKLEALTQPRPSTVGSQRNPFRFYVPPPPPPPKVEMTLKPPPRIEPEEPVGPPPEVGPPQPPKISLTMKYIGLMEGVPGRGKVAAFSDCRSTMRGSEGDIIDGRYRLVRIGVESVVMEYVDGRGRETIRQSGQDCVTK